MQGWGYNGSSGQAGRLGLGAAQASQRTRKVSSSTSSCASMQGLSAQAGQTRRTQGWISRWLRQHSGRGQAWLKQVSTSIQARQHSWQPRQSCSWHKRGMRTRSRSCRGCSQGKGVHAGSPQGHTACSVRGQAGQAGSPSSSRRKHCLRSHSRPLATIRGRSRPCAQGRGWGRGHSQQAQGRLGRAWPQQGQQGCCSSWRRQEQSGGFIRLVNPSLRPFGRDDSGFHCQPMPVQHYG